MDNWQIWQFVLAAARHGSMSEAGRQMGVDATTISRRIKRLEKQTGRQLFNRQGVRLKPTMFCLSLLPELENAANAMARLNRQSGTTKTRFVRAVRISSLAMITDHLLAPNLPKLLDDRKIRVELISESRNIILSRREADIAVRLAKPAAGAGRTIKVGDVKYCTYVRDGVDPDSVLWATYTDEMAHLPETKWTRGQGDAKSGVHLATNAHTLFEMVAAGTAKALLPQFLADHEPKLVAIERKPVLSRQAWIVTHPEDKGAAHIEKTIEWIVGIFANAGTRP